MISKEKFEEKIAELEWKTEDADAEDYTYFGQLTAKLILCKYKGMLFMLVDGDKRYLTEFDEHEELIDFAQYFMEEKEPVHKIYHEGFRIEIILDEPTTKTLYDIIIPKLMELKLTGK